MRGMADKERIDLVVGHVTKALPGLEELRLSAPTLRKKTKRQQAAGEHIDPADIRIQPWGSAVRWEEFIATRWAEAEKLTKAKEQLELTKKLKLQKDQQAKAEADKKVKEKYEM